MGIRGLAHMLESYRVAVDFWEVGGKFDAAQHEPHRAEDRDDVGSLLASEPESGWPRSMRTEQIVIDGPALAYHAYYAALSCRADAQNAIEAIPSYAEVNAKAVEMLDNFSKHGLRIRAIFFDGALPESKRETRIQRLNSYLLQMQKYRSLHTGSPSAGNLSMNYKYRQATSPTSSGDIFIHNGSQVPAKLKTLPALPFMVPSVIEAIQAHPNFAMVTAVVPGEADTFCAIYARRYSAMILTSDSDLLAYELHPNSSVAFLKDIEMHKTNIASRLRIPIYATIDIAKQMGILSMTSFAFAVRNDLNRSRKQCIEQAVRVEVDRDLDFNQFSAGYDIKEPAELSDHNAVEYFSSMASWRLDPRVSEFCRETHDLSAVEGSPAHMYLPVLIEDTNRASAWEMSTELRAIAYTLLSTHGRRTRRTLEVLRKGDRVTEVAIEHINDSTFGRILLALMKDFDMVFELDIPTNIQWTFYGTFYWCRGAARKQKQLPSKPMLKALLRRRRLHLDWALVQLSAQIQATLYSLRMIQQCSRMIQVTSPAQLVGTPDLNRCLQRLQALPSIPSLFDEAQDIEDDDLEKCLTCLYSLLGLNETAWAKAAMPESNRSKKKRKRAERQLQAQAKEPALSSNIYSLLSTD